MSKTETSSVCLEDKKALFVSISHTFLCFDVDNSSDAKQTIDVQRVPNEKGRIAWRIRTNAPTRYIVNPNSGIFTEKDRITTVTITLLENRFDPRHEILLQAIKLNDDEDPKKVWNSKKTKELENCQLIRLELSTTIVNFSTSELSKQQTALDKIMDETGKMNFEERIVELEKLEKMLEADCEIARANLPKAERLNEVLQTKLEEKTLELFELQNENNEMDELINNLQQPKQNGNQCNMV